MVGDEALVEGNNEDGLVAPPLVPLNTGVYGSNLADDDLAVSAEGNLDDDAVEEDNQDAGTTDDAGGSDCGDIPGGCAEGCVGEAVANMCEELQDALDIDAKLNERGAPNVPAELSRWILTHLSASTKQGTYMKEHGWRIFISIMQERLRRPFVLGADWPPSVEDWVWFLTECRPLVSSHERFRCLVSSVCKVGQAWCVLNKGMRSEKADPRSVHQAFHSRTMRTLRRHYGMNTRQVKGITMVEARNMFRFVDSDSLREVSWMAAFGLGCVLGGRRPRTIVGIKLKDIQFMPCPVTVKGHGPAVLPGIKVVFRDEKTVDVDGFRHGTEDLSHWEVTDLDELQRGPGWWVYRLLVMRNAFDVVDPLGHRPPGARLEPFTVAASCAEEYLLCECGHDWFAGCVPISTGVLSNYNRQLLQRFGSSGRGFSSHRRGCITRAATSNLLENCGMGIDEALLHAITRWGGWRAVTGIQTVLRIYLATTIDNYVCGHGLGLGRRKSKEEWERRRLEYLGPDIMPTETYARGTYPLRVRMAGWHVPTVARWRQDVTTACNAIMKMGKGDTALYPVDRYMSDKELLNAALKKYPNHPSCGQYRTLMSQAAGVAAAGIDEAVTELMEAFYRDGGAGASLNRTQRWTKPTLMRHIQPVSIGGFPHEAASLLAHGFLP